MTLLVHIANVFAKRVFCKTKTRLRAVKKCYRPRKGKIHFRERVLVSLPGNKL